MSKKPNPKKPKTKKKDRPTTDDKVTSKDVMKMPSESLVRSLASDIASTRKQTGKLTGELSEIIAAAKKNKGVHPGALKRVEALVNKAKNTDRGLAAVATEIAHFEFYCDVLGLTKMLEDQGQMFKRPEAGEASDENGKDDPKKPIPLFGGKTETPETESVKH